MKKLSAIFTAWSLVAAAAYTQTGARSARELDEPRLLTAELTALADGVRSYWLPPESRADVVSASSARSC